MNVVSLDATASSFKLSYSTCYEEEIENDEDKESNCGKNDRIYYYNEYMDKYSKLNETIFKTPFIITLIIEYRNELYLQSDYINDIKINRKDKIEIDKKIEEKLRTYKLKGNCYGHYLKYDIINRL